MPPLGPVTNMLRPVRHISPTSEPTRINVIVQFLVAVGADDASVRWAVRQPDAYSAWMNCDRPEWFAWLFVTLGFEEGIEFAASHLAPFPEAAIDLSKARIAWQAGKRKKAALYAYDVALDARQRDAACDAARRLVSYERVEAAVRTRVLTSSAKHWERLADESEAMVAWDRKIGIERSPGMAPGNYRAQLYRQTACGLRLEAEAYSRPGEPK